MADCTARAAPLMSRERSNRGATVVEPRKLVEVFSFTAAMRENWLSSGVATAEAIVSGLAPGRPAETLMVGKSTWRSGATGQSRKPRGQARRGKGRKAYGPGQDQREREQRGADGPPDERAGEVHGREGSTGAPAGTARRRTAGEARRGGGRGGEGRGEG